MVQHAAVEESLRDCIQLHTLTEDSIAVGVLLTGQSFSTLVEKFGAIYYEFHPKRRGEAVTRARFELHPS